MSRRWTAGDLPAPWHKASFDRFLTEGLPALLAERLPLASYQVGVSEEGARVTVSLKGAPGEVAVTFDALPAPDEQGVFRLGAVPRVVHPIVSGKDLEAAEVRCVGEQLRDFLAARLGSAPSDLAWDEGLARNWLSLDTGFREFLTRHGQVFRPENWLEWCAMLRRLTLEGTDGELAPSHFGRVCPLETPENENIGRVVVVAVGAEIRDGRLVVTDPSPEAGLGVTASMIPLLEHDDSCRALMGCNLMRQWLAPPDPEPALVRTGKEVDAPGFWCGRNLLTAYLSLGVDTYEDSIVLSRSAAQRLGYPKPIEPGDKLSNRHGTKGVLSRVLPDEEMPHLPDGTPVDLVYSFQGLHTRMNFGQVREAMMGRIARAEGSAAIVPPYGAPTDEELRERLRRNGLPESGMERLTLGWGGARLPLPSTVGWVYWGRDRHQAITQFQGGEDPERAHVQSYLEYLSLREARACENLLEQFNTRAAERPDSGDLPQRVAAGRVDQAGPPSPQWASVARRLGRAGIRAEVSDGRLELCFAEPEGEALVLARPVPHPWLPSEALRSVGGTPKMWEYAALVEANARAGRMLAEGAPESLTQRALEELEARVRAYLEALLPARRLRPHSRALFSARAVASPGAELTLEQVGVPEEMAWGLFTPLVARELGSLEAARARDERASRALDAVLARSWVVLNRCPSVEPTAFIAFRPVRHPERVLRIHPLVCPWMNADFDGDVLNLFLPVTEAGQREAAEGLSVAGHVARDPAVLGLLGPRQDSLWGLAHLSLMPEGRRELAELAGTEIAAPEGFVTRDTVDAALRRVLDRDGLPAALAALERLTRRGFEVARATGASLSPFFGSSLELPPRPEGAAAEDLDLWQAWGEAVENRIASRTDYGSSDLGPQLLAAKSGARGSVRQLAVLRAGAPLIVDAKGRLVHFPGSRVRGMSAEAYTAHTVGMRRGLLQMVHYWSRGGPLSLWEEKRTRAFTVLARALRARRPGIVFAQAAATGETDPLTDLDSRLFVGLPPASE